jgi:6-phosphogluconolactonase
MSKVAVLIFPDLEALSRVAAEHFALLASEAVAQNGRFLVALSGGSTPQPLFRWLSQPPYNETIPWSQTHIFWGDERLVPADDPGSSYHVAQELLLGHVPIPTDQIHRAKGEMEQETAVADYSQQLKQLAEPDRAWPRFDLVLMGLGSDGHTASLFPGAISEAEKTEPVIAVTANYDGRPANRISLTPLVFNDARHILFMAVGENKAAALTAVLNHSGTPAQWPAQRIQPHHGSVLWLVDEAAASQL